MYPFKYSARPVRSLASTYANTRGVCAWVITMSSEVELLASAGQVLVVVDGCADAESADQTYAAGIFIEQA
jgi:hypothetical protein